MYSSPTDMGTMMYGPSLMKSQSMRSKRKSAVELLAESKPFYVKSEIVRGTTQSLPQRPISSGYSNSTSAAAYSTTGAGTGAGQQLPTSHYGTYKRSKSVTVTNSGGGHGNNVITRPTILPQQYMAVSPSRSLPPLSHRRSIHMPPAASTPGAGTPSAGSALPLSCCAVAPAGYGLAIPPQQTSNNHSISSNAAGGSDALQMKLRQLLVGGGEDSNDEDLLNVEHLGPLSPPAEYAAACGPPPQRCHKSLPDLHCRGGGGGGGGVGGGGGNEHNSSSNKSSNKSLSNRDSGGSSGHYTQHSEPPPMLPLHTVHVSAVSASVSQHQHHNYASMVHAAAQQHQHQMLLQQQHLQQQQQQQFLYNTSGGAHVVLVGVGGTSPRQQETRRDSGSSTQHSGASSYYYCCAEPDCRQSSSSPQQQHQYQQMMVVSTAPTSLPPPASFMPPIVQHCGSGSGGGASPPAGPGVLYALSHASMHNMNKQPMSLPPPPLAVTANSGGMAVPHSATSSPLLPPPATFKRQKCLRYKRDRPILRSKSDISDRYWRPSLLPTSSGDHQLIVTVQQAAAMPLSAAGVMQQHPHSQQPVMAVSHLEQFFEHLGLTSDRYEDMFTLSRSSSSPVFFSDVSTVDSSVPLLDTADYNSAHSGHVGGACAVPQPTLSSGGAALTAQPPAAFRANEPPSIVERNARIIKWLCNCRKAQMA